jgi:SAM-dependent methyltransferase
MRRLTDWYRHPRYYEAVFGADTERELDFLEQVNGWFGTSGSLWLEPACGAGRLVEGAVRRGHTIIGHDVSTEMLGYSRQRLPGAGPGTAHLFEARMEAFRPARWRRRIDLAFCLVSTFRYLSSDDAALAHLGCIRELLRPEGVYALGFHLTDYRRRHAEHERWVARLGDEEIVCNTREWPPDRVRRRARMRNRLRVKGPGGTQEIETEWYFRTWSENEAHHLFERAGFSLLAAYGFEGDLARPLAWNSTRLDRIMILRAK